MARGRANPLALAVLSLLNERPMHPYEMSTTMRSRGKHESIKLNYGSLYTVVESLAKRGLIAPTGTLRDGRRPERTVYELTETGRIEHADWLAELLSTPGRDFTSFEAALSLVAGLPPTDVTALLEERVNHLDVELAQIDGALQAATRQGVPRLFLVETEYRRELRRAERDFTERLAESISDGSIGGVDLWEKWHAEPGFDVAAELEARMRE